MSKDQFPLEDLGLFLDALPGWIHWPPFAVTDFQIS